MKCKKNIGFDKKTIRMINRKLEDENLRREGYVIADPSGNLADIVQYDEIDSRKVSGILGYHVSNDTFFIDSLKNRPETTSYMDLLPFSRYKSGKTREIGRERLSRSSLVLSEIGRAHV